MSKPLSREDFRQAVFARDRMKCVLCDQTAVDPHHILERALFADGGYYLDNGAAVCASHHMACERTDVSVEQVRRAAGIRRAVLPPGFDPSKSYDKWGNEILPDGRRRWGPLAGHPGMLKIMAGKLSLFG